MSEPAYELTLEDLADSPHLWGEALRSVARGRVVHLVQGDLSMSLTSFLTVPSKRGGLSLASFRLVWRLPLLTS